MSHVPSDPLDVTDDGAVMQRIDPGIAEQMAGAQIGQLIETARRFPRSVHTSMKQAIELATLDEDTAMSCSYALPRGGKTITGPSVRFAEIIASCWGNLWVQCTPIAEDNRFVTVRAVCWDVEKNLCVAFDVIRGITDRNGRKFNNDMVVVTTNAAASVAFRNAVLRVVPEALTRSVLEAARKVVRGDSVTLQARRDKMFTHFFSMGVDENRVFAALGVDARQDIGLDEFEVLLGIANGIKNDGLSVDSVFPNVTSARDEIKSKGGTRTSALKERLQEREDGGDDAAKESKPKSDDSKEEV